MSDGQLGIFVAVTATVLLLGLLAVLLLVGSGER